MSTTDDESITVYADYVCPFCFLGRESLRQYQETRGDDLQVDWHPFDLRANQRGPDGEIDESVDSGKDDEYYEQARENVRRLQDKYGVEMELDLAKDVDSLDAQVASYYVQGHHDYETWREFDEAVYDALWREGRDIGDPDVLTDVAEDVGVDPEEIRSALEDETLRGEVTDRFEAAQGTGITGVPTFVYEDYAARGAVPPEHLERLVEGEHD